ncbi:hypothetical protein [Lysobacter silvisoli]|uniref:Uncharacterized protein n=1 Tax=Lysobacter silvisoli TaxID=2293254 RepID=A0A371K0L7_9GAMM|nr:hypothetical protein [Lysobacter silvisoli]RDZ27455.1 hypothetical protein DX914_14610 [Lysobacter silvisoli]
MTWSYQYPARTATHLETGLVFSITYDAVHPTWDVHLDGEWPASVTEVQVSALAEELVQFIRDRYIQREMSELLHGAYGGDFELASMVLRRQTNKKVSVRTLQAWMMPADRPSSRRCPEWALVALEQYLGQNPGAARGWKEVRSVYRSTPEGLASSLHQASRERSLQRVDARMAKEQKVHDKWQKASMRELPGMLAELEIRLQREADFNMEYRMIMNEAIRVSENFEEFKRNFNRELGRKFDLDGEEREIAEDLTKNRNEFAREDGTKPD